MGLYNCTNADFLCCEPYHGLHDGPSSSNGTAQSVAQKVRDCDFRLASTLLG
jgi:hypothetical protein